MIENNYGRREILRAIALAAGASHFPGFSRWAFACPQHPDEHKPVTPRPATYKPQFFSGDEYSLLERLTELIIPSDDTPGAKEAGVSEFIDFMVASDPDIQFGFRYGLGWMNTHARWLHGTAFLQLSEEQQTAILKKLAFQDRFQPQQEDGQAFFKLLRDYTVMGFYTSRVGLENLDYPGLQLAWERMPECNHFDDPEHRNLPDPIA